jgi:hypothetical protein
MVVWYGMVWYGMVWYGGTIPYHTTIPVGESRE